MHLTLRQLQCFSAVARNLSYTKAADELHLTQPAVSMQIRQLEQQAGLALTEQFGKQVHLTEAGEEVYRYARSILQQVDEMDDVLDKLKGFAGGRLKIALYLRLTISPPGCSARFTSVFPTSTSAWRSPIRKAVLKQVVDNEVDMAIMGQPPKDSHVEAISVHGKPADHCCPARAPSCKAQAISLKELEKEVFLTREPGSGTRGAMERFFREQKLKLTTGMGMGSLSSIKQGVQANLGLGLLPRDAVRVELQIGRLVELKVKGLPIKRHWYVVLHKGKRLSLAAEEFKTLLTDEAVDLLAD